MKAIVFREKGDLELEEYTLPPLKHGWVRIRVEEAGICGSDVHVRNKGFLFEPGDLEGQVLGHENAGVVVELGKGVTSTKEGERVVANSWVTCGKCPYCQTGNLAHCPELKIIGYAYPGGFAPFVDAPEELLFKIPDSVSFSEGCQIDPAACGIHALALAELKAGGTVVVIGDGAIGLFAVQAAALHSPRNLILAGMQKNSLRLASQLGATNVIDVTEADPVEAVEEITRGEGVDAVIEAVGGTADTMQQAIGMARPTGRIIVMGVFTGLQPVSMETVLLKGLKIVGGLAYTYWGLRHEFQRALDLLEATRIKVEPLITHKVALERTAEGFDLLKDKNRTGAIKVTVLPQQ
jgi:threonine dehydrogenase-like Zn-dependent dehydrogenase